MKTLDEFTIWCTEEQTKLALELGASIETEWHEETMYVAYDRLVIPTAEQMIGWLETQGIFIHVDYDFSDNEKPYKCEMYLFNGMACHKGWFTSRGEAILVAINAALEYLSSNKG